MWLSSVPLGLTFFLLIRMSSKIGGRNSSKSRGQSFRHPAGRTSTKSADSALALSECMTSYSDTECKYNEERDTNFEAGPLRASQHSSYSDTVVVTRAGDLLTPSNSVKARVEYERAKPVAETPKSADTHSDSQVAVLFNKYALDRDESMRAQKPERYSNRSSSTLPRQKSQAYSQNAQYQSSPYGGSLKRQMEFECPDPPLTPQMPGRSSRKGQNSSPRVMTPMGFAVSRQSSSRQQRLSRLREDPDYDYDYDYDDYAQSEKIKPVPIWLCVCLVISYIIGGAFLFHEWEKWPLLDSAYFCFITLTTIGFGDFVPAQKVKGNPEVSIALCSLYLLFGIALLAMSFNLVQEEVINNVKSIAKRLGIIKEDEENE